MTLSLLLIVTGILLTGIAAWLLEWKPTADWPLAWRKWSTWLAGLNAALWAYITAHTGLLLGFIPFVSSDYRGFAAGAVFVVGVILPVLAVHIRQTKLEGKSNG